jgi:hypothetical protein
VWAFAKPGKTARPRPSIRSAVGVARDDLGRGTDGGDPVALDQDRSRVVDGLGDVAADHGGVVDERGHD